jgi:hypothetical protein
MGTEKLNTNGDISETLKLHVTLDNQKSNLHRACGPEW